MKDNQLFPDEVTVIQMALTVLIEDHTAVMQDPTIPLTPEARTLARDMLKNAKSALAKIALVSGKLIQMDAYQEGDEKEFLTKES